MRKIILPLSIAAIYCSSQIIQAASTQAPKIQLAKTYHDKVTLSEFFVSEKLDGIRAYWTGSKLITRFGNPINAPEWFINSLPETALDGELWVGRGQFERVSSIVRKIEPIDSEWQSVKFMVFDLPANLEPFTKRIKKLENIVTKLNIRHLEYVQQFKIESQNQLDKALAGVNAIGGEGLMLARANSFYQSKRTDDLLKVKSYRDEEAVVLKYIPGKGKYIGLMGSLLVETKDGVRFKIGTGFTDKDRAEPPIIGSQITFRYRGRTKNGIPRFASFMRIRDDF